MGLQTHQIKILKAASSNFFVQMSSVCFCHSSTKWKANFLLCPAWKIRQLICTPFETS